MITSGGALPGRPERPPAAGARQAGDGPLIGRGAEQARIEASLRGSGPSILLLLGETGSGKSALLRYGTQAAEAEGRLAVATAGGAPGELDVLLAVLRQLAESGIEPPGRAIWQILHEDPDGSAEPGEPPAVRRRLAAFAFLEAVCRRRPVMIAVDDVRPADSESLAVLMFIARRLPSRSLVLLLASGGLAPFPRSAVEEVSLCRLAPLGDADAAALLDRGPSAPTGRLRGEILRRSAGNPLALIELSAAARTGAGTPWSLGITERAAAAFAGPAAGLPADTRRLRRYAAAGEEEDLSTVLTAAGAGLEDCRPAEEAELIAVIGGELTFRHPMLSTVLYFGAPERERRRAHARLAAVLPAGSGRHAWHLANAAPSTPGLDIAALFERAADAAVRERRYLHAADALHRAEKASPAARDAGDRYARAAAEAARGCDMEWCRELFDGVLALTDDPEVLAKAAIGIAYQVMTHPYETTIGMVDRLLDAGVQDRGVAVYLLSMASSTVLMHGAPDALPALRRLVERIEDATLHDGRNGTGGAVPQDGSEYMLAYAQAVADPAGWVRAPGPLRASPLVRPASGERELFRLLNGGAIAWLVDDPHIAADYSRRALALLRSQDSIATAPGTFVMFAENLIEMGLWEEASAVLDQAGHVLASGGFTLLHAASTAQRATLLTRRGRLSQARRALAGISDFAVHDSRLVRCLGHRAAGQLAAAEGDAAGAADHFLALFEPDGRPVHHHFAPRSVTELVHATMAAGRPQAASGPLAAVARSAEVNGPVRGPWLLRHARALLGSDADAERELRSLLDEPAARRWPYHYAVAEVDYARALRAQRRFVEARTVLTSALNTFTRLGASRDAADVQSTLRASGVRSQNPGFSTAAFDRLTAQQQQIARQAARGLTNRAIGELHGLSPRTIGSHLYKIYPLLGVVRRDQLHEVIPR
ncbi:AAA family ATPase [Spirillospora sp. NPDC046719]